MVLLVYLAFHFAELWISSVCSQLSHWDVYSGTKKDQPSQQHGGASQYYHGRQEHHPSQELSNMDPCKVTRPTPLTYCCGLVSPLYLAFLEKEHNAYKYLLQVWNCTTTKGTVPAIAFGRMHSRSYQS